MKKKTWLFILLVLSVFLVGCSGNNSGPGVIDEGANEEIIVPEVAPNRKIIYAVSMNIHSTNMNTTINEIKSSLGANDWVEKESRYDRSATIRFRIKTERLNTFVKSLRDSYKTDSFKLDATDVSVNYYDLTNRKTALLNEQERLLELYETASMAEMIQINQRLSEIEVELQRLNKEINQYDSLIEYSTVSIQINQVGSTEERSFFRQVGDGFVTGWKSLVTFLKGLVIVLSYVLPWVLVIAPVSIGVIYGVKYFKKKK